MTQVTLSTLNLISLVSSITCINEQVPLMIERQLRNDTVYFSSGCNSCTVDGKVTYLVDDKKCVSNQELLNGNCLLSTLYHT